MNSFNQYYWYDMWMSYQYPLHYYQVVPVYYLAATGSPGAVTNALAPLAQAVPASTIRYQMQHNTTPPPPHQPLTSNSQCGVDTAQPAGGKKHENAEAATPQTMIMCSNPLISIAPSPLPPTPSTDLESAMSELYPGHHHHHHHHHPLLPSQHHHHQHQHHLHNHQQPMPHHFIHSTLVTPPLVQPPPPITLAPPPPHPTSTTTINKPVIAFSQPNLSYNLISMLPVDAQPTKTRQAYGMDKVWQDEFESLFSQFFSNITWTLLEVESNPNIRDDSSSIIDYRGRYIIEVTPTTHGESQKEDKVVCENDESTRASFTSEEGYQEGEEEEEEKGETINMLDETLDTAISHKNELDSKMLDQTKTIQLYDEKSEDEINIQLNDTTSVQDSHKEQDQHGVVPLEVLQSNDGVVVERDEEQEEEEKEKEDVVEVEEDSTKSVSGQEVDSDCDSGAQVNSTSETCCLDDLPSESNCFSSQTNTTTQKSPSLKSSLSSSSKSSSSSISSSVGNNGSPTIDLSASNNDTTGRKFPTRFRMFIDSAKVRFCCDNCGHGWTSMKGRVVFWYELFEVIYSSTNEELEQGQQYYTYYVNNQPPNPLTGPVIIDDNQQNSYLIGYCAYKLFGQQCEVCKIENRFERPMWYPEEVTKVLNNLYTKIGQVYFGFKMPAIIKQRRAGKPKTSHNNSLCQACHDGVCTDRK